MKIEKSWLRNDLPQILLIIFGIFAMRSSLADHYYVPSGSMEYTLLSGDRVLVSKVTYGLRVPFTNFEFLDGRPVGRGDGLAGEGGWQQSALDFRGQGERGGAHAPLEDVGVPAGGNYKYQMPADSGAHFYTTNWNEIPSVRA